MMSISYLLDTSAFRSLSAKVIQNIPCQHVHLFVSPYCFWELLCHLDEKEKFDYYKAHLLKFKYVKVLDDPDAEFDTSFFPNNPKLQERGVSDDEIIYRMVSALDASDSLKTFYSKTIRTSDERSRQLADCATRVRETLKQRDERYIDFIRNIIKMLQSEQLDINTDKHRHQRILEFVEIEVRELQKKGVSESGLREKVITDSYIEGWTSHLSVPIFRNQVGIRFRIGSDRSEPVRSLVPIFGITSEPGSE